MAGGAASVLGSLGGSDQMCVKASRQERSRKECTRANRTEMLSGEVGLRSRGNQPCSQKAVLADSPIYWRATEHQMPSCPCRPKF